MQAGGRRFDPVRLHHGCLLGLRGVWMVVRDEVVAGDIRSDDLCCARRGCVSTVVIVRCLSVFFHSVKRLVRICACRDAGWSDPAGSERSFSPKSVTGLRTEA